MNSNPTQLYSVLVEAIKKAGLFPKPTISHSSASKSTIQVNGRKMLSFTSNNYLGMSDSDKIKKIVINALKKYGISSGSTRILGGSHDIHEELEKTLATFIGTEDAIVFSTGYMANIGALPAIINPMNIPGMSERDPKKDEITVFSDRSNHGSIHDAIKLAKCEKVVFRHNDMLNLENHLKNCVTERKLVITQGVFTTDGSIVPLPELIKLTKKYSAMLWLDDADAIGVLGINGGGTPEYFNQEVEDIDFYMGTMTKAFGVFGGFVAGKKYLIDYIRVASKTSILSAPLPPILSAAVNESIKIVKKMHNERKKIIQIAKKFKHGMINLGYNILGDNAPVMLVLIGDDNIAINIGEKLFSEGIMASVVRYPAVPWGESRIRFSFTADHSEQDVSRLISFFKRIKDSVIK